MSANNKQLPAIFSLSRFWTIMAKKEKKSPKKPPKKIHNTHKKSRAKKKPQDKKSRDYIAISPAP